MLYVRRPVERVTPFLRDELFHAMGSGPDQDAKVQDLKELLGKQVSPTLVLAIGSDMPGATGEGWLVAQESARQRLAVALDEDIGQTRYLLLPVGAGRFAICLDLPEDQARVLADKLHASIAADAQVGRRGPLLVTRGRRHTPATGAAALLPRGADGPARGRSVRSAGRQLHRSRGTAEGTPLPGRST